MSNFTNYAENAIAEWIRGQGITLPSSWYIAPASAADDGSFNEIATGGLARAAIVSSLANWAGTQAAGSTLASSGTSHVSSNNVEIDMGTATAAVGTVSHVGLFDASSSGNAWVWAALASPIVTANAVDVKIPIGELTLTFGLSSGASDYLSNKLIDKFLRGQAFSWPASMWLAACTSAPSNAGGGTEVGGGVGYARKEVAGNYTNWSGTQGAGTTVASSGASGRISNNALIEFADPTGDWGAISHGKVMDASEAGNMLFWGAHPATKSIGVGTRLKYQADEFGITLA